MTKIIIKLFSNKITTPLERMFIDLLSVKKKHNTVHVENSVGILQTGCGMLKVPLGLFMELWSGACTK